MIRALLNLRDPPLSRVVVGFLISYFALLWALGVFEP